MAEKVDAEVSARTNDKPRAALPAHEERRDWCDDDRGPVRIRDYSGSATNARNEADLGRICRDIVRSLSPHYTYVDESVFADPAFPMPRWRPELRDEDELRLEDYRPLREDARGEGARGEGARPLLHELPPPAGAKAFAYQ